MNFIKFPVASTNIFPIANTTTGGQLVTEFNLRSRESVYSDPSVEYFIGPSFVHSMEDFKVSQSSAPANFFSDSTNQVTLQIAPGRGVINGHYVECLTPITIDLLAASQAAQTAGESDWIGSMSVGLRAMYSTETTISGSILTENGNDLYEGIQVVILPTADFKLPKDSPDDQSEVNADILLATFNYYNGSIQSIVNNTGKCEMLDALRIRNMNDVLSKNYPSKANLNPKKFYTLAGKYNPSDDYWSPEWCDSTGSIMVWGSDIPEIVNEQPTIGTAQFVRGNKSVSLVVPHKQIDGMANDHQFFAPVVLPIPVANYEAGTPGTVDAEYTANVKAVLDKINNVYQIPNGKLKAYVPELTSISLLPQIDQDWNIGDYILVGQDSTFNYTLADSSRKPSTMYAVIPGIVTRIAYATTNTIPVGAEDGVMLSKIESDRVPNISDPDVYNNSDQYWNLPNYRGVPGKDYFIYVYKNTQTGLETYYYYLVQTAGAKSYSDTILITGGVPLAEEKLVGGFLNSPDTAVDAGYVYLDSKGYLRLRDYELLRSGTLAYQLGEDYSVPKGLTLTEIQAYLDEYVNQRVVFPNSTQLKNSDPNRIHVYIPISDNAEGELNIYDLDSRFNTAVCIHITAEESINVTINISDCQKVQIERSVATNTFTSNVILNIYRSGVYYDAYVFDFVETMQDISLWYDRFDSTDPILSVEGMTVTQMMYDGEYTENNVDTISDWSSINVNDYHFNVALQSLTFSSDGYIAGCGVLVRNNSTTNVLFGKNVISSAFTLPQGPNLLYPASRLVRPIKVTGSFVSAYTDSASNMVVQNTGFSLKTQYTTTTQQYNGNISFLIDAYSVPVSQGTNTPPEWEPSSFNYFYGTTMF